MLRARDTMDRAFAQPPSDAGRPRKCSAIGMTQWSFTSRLTTMFTFTGARPAVPAASMPSSTRASGTCVSLIDSKTSWSSASRLTVTRRKPS